MSEITPDIGSTYEDITLYMTYYSNYFRSGALAYLRINAILDEEILEYSQKYINWSDDVNEDDYKVFRIPLSGNLLDESKLDNKCGYKMLSSSYLKYDVFNIPSPYLNNDAGYKDSRNFHFNSNATLYPYIENVFSDFDGKRNTLKMQKDSTVENWKTRQNLTPKEINGTNSGFKNDQYVAALCAYRFHTIGTNQGDWYIPAAGELMYLTSRKNIIENSARMILNDDKFTYNPQFSSTLVQTGCSDVNAVNAVRISLLGIIINEGIINYNNFRGAFVAYLRIL